MASTKGRKPPLVVVRRPPEMPGLDVLDPSATAAFVDGKPMEVPKAPVPQAIDAPSHQRPEAPVLQGMEPSTSLDPSPAPVPGAPAESEVVADESTDASVTTGIGASRTRSTKASKSRRCFPNPGSSSCGPTARSTTARCRPCPLRARTSTSCSRRSSSRTPLGCCRRTAR